MSKQWLCVLLGGLTLQLSMQIAVSQHLWVEGHPRAYAAKARQLVGRRVCTAWPAHAALPSSKGLFQLPTGVGAPHYPTCSVFYLLPSPAVLPLGS